MCEDENKNCEECCCEGNHDCCDNDCKKGKCNCDDKGCCGKGRKCGRRCCRSFMCELGKVVIMSAFATATALLVTHLINKVLK